jgi:hypothetical protein
MSDEQEKRRLEGEIEKLQELAKAYPDGSIYETIMDLIGELQEKIDSLDE